MIRSDFIYAALSRLKLQIRLINDLESLDRSFDVLLVIKYVIVSFLSEVARGHV